ncbi:hypothetical protein BOX15_Mlig009897g1, partial [Macrostomum lignano]
FLEIYSDDAKKLKISLMRIYCYNSGLLIYSFLFLFTIIHDCRSLPSRSVTTVRHWHWPGLQTDSWLALPACGNSTDNVVWFDGGRRRRKRLKYWAGRLFNGCAAYYRIGDRLLVHLRPRLLNHCGNIYQELSLTCLVVRHSSKAAINAANQLMNLHSLQLIYDDRCPPGTARDRLGLCRRCRRRLLQRRNRHRHLRFRFDHTDSRFDHSDSRFDHSDSRFDHSDSRFDHSDSRFDHSDGRFDPSDSRFDHTDVGTEEDVGDCWQPTWNAASCPICYYPHISNASDSPAAPDKPNRLRPVLLRRSRRSVNAKKPLVLRTSTGKVRVEQLRCPNRISVVASITCLLEMQKPIQCEMISLVVTSFTLIAYLSMPIYVGYVFIQVQSARFLPFLQFHVYHRSALLCSAMRTQAVFASSLWDFEAFREAEKRRRLVQQDMSQRHHKCDFNRRELPNLFFWYGVKENQ